MPPLKPRKKLMSFEKRFDLLKERYEKHGFAYFFAYEGDGSMNSWLRRVRLSYKKYINKVPYKTSEIRMTHERVVAFEELGFQWVFVPKKDDPKILEAHPEFAKTDVVREKYYRENSKKVLEHVRKFNMSKRTPKTPDCWETDLKGPKKTAKYPIRMCLNQHCFIHLASFFSCARDTHVNWASVSAAA